MDSDSFSSSSVSSTFTIGAPELQGMYRMELTYSNSIKLSDRPPLLIYHTREHDLGGRL
jgi:hypothetical protein